MIIIEGADCTGKTTLARKIVTELNRLGFPHVYRHLGRLPKSWRQDPVRCHRLLMSPYVVMDRFHMSEPLYRAVDGTPSMLGKRDYERLDRDLLAYCGHVLVVSTTEGRIRATHGQKEELYTADQAVEVNAHYAEVGRCGSWRGIDMRVDQHYSGADYPEVRDAGLRAYTLRLLRDFPYPGAKSW